MEIKLMLHCICILYFSRNTYRNLKIYLSVFLTEIQKCVLWVFISVPHRKASSSNKVVFPCHRERQPWVGSLTAFFEGEWKIHPWISHGRGWNSDHMSAPLFRPEVRPGCCWLFLCFIFLCRKPLLRPCSNCLPCCCALENTQWGHGQGLLMFWRWQKDSSGSVPWLNQLAQVSHLWCGLANRQLFLTSEGRLQLCLLLSPIHIVQLSRCVKCPTFFMLPV